MSSEERSRQPSTVSTFDLEPNPFEQSFASSKKALSLPGTISHPSLPKEPSRNNSTSTITQHSQRSTHSLNSIPEENGNPTVTDNSNHNDVKKDSPSFLTGQQRPTIISPPILTPGGSKRLPPLLLSPSILYQANSTSNPNQNSHPVSVSNSNPSAIGVSSTSGSLYPNSSSPSGTSLIRQPRNSNVATSNSGNGFPTNDSQMPGFLLNLSKSGLTPNESNIRTGLTPGILTQSYNYPVLPSINKNTITGSKNVNKSVTVNGSIENHPHVNIIHPTVNGTPLTPGLSSLLNLPSTGVLANPVFKSTPTTNTTDGTVNNSISNSNFSPNTSTKAAVKMDNPAEFDAIEHSAHNHKENENLTTQIENNDQFNNKTRKRKRRMSSTSSTSKASRKNSILRKNSAVTTAPAQKDDVENNKISNNVTLDENEEQERKRKEFLERNRVAASKFRKRKKEYIKKIENDLQFYESEYDDLTQVIGKLCGIIPSSSSNSQFNVNVSTPSSSSSPPSTSLIALLESSISRSDYSSAMSVLSNMKQLVCETNFYRRGGKNPRDDMDVQEDSFNKDTNVVKSENAGYPSVNSRPIILDKKYSLNSGANISKSNTTTNNVGNSAQNIINSCYSVTNPLVINANSDTHDTNKHDVLSTLPHNN
ncbi:XXYS1_4_G0013140.mRNA.1.CDS.1 [Saccharomyces cerevisiae]|nr:EM14S01-3B_G0010490.mRNA.1.CDS.1 [Saccharomyces cerevisiae]CAD6644059.1 XXYS1_4_G0013140.mRNA.1.CDS.1 [Saccharomyces cerevisiae]CAI4729351.1 CEI_1a_G0044870.mRNA.1.CDS.1 [Saccharomyces cerevisiae]CAI4731046.1 AMH_1a_G0044970.mRNA.1.CDS.1 [Saccharomyces cerevisiae]CAI6857682.1 AMH_1a_G0044970.mRNA.1.CDS.1 [Saccharomyces cerevisiae]